MCSGNKDKYAELQLYFGICTADLGVGEGKFDPNSNEKYAQAHYDTALTVVIRRINSWIDVHIGGINPVVQNETEAGMLIAFAETSYPGARGDLSLVDSMHGKIRFWRGIIFPSASETSSEEIIRMMQSSGFEPRDVVRENEARSLKQVASNEDLEKELRKLGLGMDRIWRENLKFH